MSYNKGFKDGALLFEQQISGHLIRNHQILTIDNGLIPLDMPMNAHGKVMIPLWEEKPDRIIYWPLKEGGFVIRHYDDQWKLESEEVHSWPEDYEPETMLHSPLLMGDYVYFSGLYDYAYGMKMHLETKEFTYFVRPPVLEVKKVDDYSQYFQGCLEIGGGDKFLGYFDFGDGIPDEVKELKKRIEEVTEREKTEVPTHPVITLPLDD